MLELKLAMGLVWGYCPGGRGPWCCSLSRSRRRRLRSFRIEPITLT